QVVEPIELGPRRERRLHPVDEGFQQLLLGVGVDQAPGGVAVLGLDDSPDRTFVGAEVTFSPALHPDTRRHEPGPPRSGCTLEGRLTGARSARGARPVPSPSPLRPARRGYGRDGGRAARSRLPCWTDPPRAVPRPAATRRQHSLRPPGPWSGR